MCAPKPEELCMAKRLIESNFAVVAMENMKEITDAETADVDIVAAAFDRGESSTRR